MADSNFLRVEMKRDWSEIGHDYLDQISRKLPLISDYHGLRLVCQSWAQWIPKVPICPKIAVPQLLFAQPSGDGDGCSCKLFDLVNNKGSLWSLNLDASWRRIRLCGSSHGWIILVKASGDLLCLNPVTKGQVCLPPLSAFPNVTEVNLNSGHYELTNLYGISYQFTPEEMQDKYIKKIILSSSPANKAEFIALAIIHYGCRLAFCKTGDTNWRIIPGANTCAEDVLHWNGWFYVLHRQGKLVRCNLSGLEPTLEVVVDAQLPVVHRGFTVRHYLVNSDENIFAISRRMNDQDHPLATERFSVYKLDLFEDDWVQQCNLDGNMVFLGLNSSISLPSSIYHGMKGDVIYFSDEFATDNRYNVVREWADMGKFDVVKRTTERFSNFSGNGNSPPCYSPPVWLTPKGKMLNES